MKKYTFLKHIVGFFSIYLFICILPSQAMATYYNYGQIYYTVNTGPVVPLVADAGPDKTIALPANGISGIIGTATGGSGTITSSNWSFVGGPTGGIVLNPNSSGSSTHTTTLVNMTLAGTYQYRYTATDSLGATAQDTMLVVVSPGNLPPTANAGPDQLGLPWNTTAISLSGSGTDPEGGALSYSWTGTVGTSIVSPSSASTSVTGLTSGSSDSFYTYTLTVTDSGGLTATDSMTVSVNATAPPSGTLSATGCTIFLTQSNCIGTISWTTANLTANPTAITRNIGSPASFTPSPLAGWSQITTLEYGWNTFYLYHNSVLLNQVSVSVACASGTSWNGSSCQTIQPPSGTISATSCTIPANGFSCPNSVSWTTANLTANPTSITSSTGTPSSFTPSPLAGGSQPTTIMYGWNTFYLYHNSVLLNQVSALASCENGTLWTGASCQSIPTATLSANPTSIIAGNSSTLTWTSTNTSTCSGFGTGFNTSGLTSGSVPVFPATTTTYTVSCTGPAGTADAVTTVIVSAPAPDCNDGNDNDGDGLKDINDPGCHSDGNAANGASYVPSDGSEVNKRKPVFQDF